MTSNLDTKNKQKSYIKEEKKFPYIWFLIYALVYTWIPSTFFASFTQNFMWFVYFLPLGSVISYIVIHNDQLNTKESDLEKYANRAFPLHVNSKLEDKILSLVEKRANQFFLLKKLKGAYQKYDLKLRFYNSNIKPTEKIIELKLKLMKSKINTITYEPQI